MLYLRFTFQTRNEETVKRWPKSLRERNLWHKMDACQEAYCCICTQFKTSTLYLPLFFQGWEYFFWSFCIRSLVECRIMSDVERCVQVVMFDWYFQIWWVIVVYVYWNRFRKKVEMCAWNMTRVLWFTISNNVCDRDRDHEDHQKLLIVSEEATNQTKWWDATFFTMLTH